MLAEYTVNFTLSTGLVETLKELWLLATGVGLGAFWIKAGMTAGLKAELRAIKARRKARKAAA